MSLNKRNYSKKSTLQSGSCVEGLVLLIAIQGWRQSGSYFEMSKRLETFNNFWKVSYRLASPSKLNLSARATNLRFASLAI